jgi:maltose O-acetyltransferase
VGRNVTFYNPSEVRLGRDVYVAYGTWFMAGAVIEVGNEVLFGPYCVIVSSEHGQDERSFRFGKGRTAPIMIGNGCWLAAHVTITAGVTLGAGAVAAAGAVVTEDVPEGTIVGGVPARAIRHLEEP